jgi:enamine deaminase RidA (YjgF/YER057c/UK114 family)
VGVSTSTDPPDRTQRENPIDAAIRRLGHELPCLHVPIGVYVGCVTSGDLTYVSGHGPRRPDEHVVRGKVGVELDAAFAKQAATYTILNVLASLRDHLGGDLGRVKRVVWMLGMVNCAPDFTDLDDVIDGASQLLVDVFGDAGKHSRTTIGMAALPMNIPIEIELVVEISEQRAA